MTPSQFRRLALSHPESLEASHMNHPDFRVGGRIFATLGAPDDSHGMVKLSLEQQAIFVTSDPDAFQPANGAWGRAGATLVRLHCVAPQCLTAALDAAYATAVELNAAKRPAATRSSRKKPSAGTT